MKHSGVETDVQSIYADKNSSLACLSLTDEGSEFIKETKAGPSGTQPGHTHPLAQCTNDFPQFLKDKEKLNTLTN